MLSVYTIELFYWFSYFNLMSFNVILYYKSTDYGNLTDVNSRVILGQNSYIAQAGGYLLVMTGYLIEFLNFLCWVLTEMALDDCIQPT